MAGCTAAVPAAPVRSAGRGAARQTADFARGLRQRQPGRCGVSGCTGLVPVVPAAIPRAARYGRVRWNTTVPPDSVAIVAGGAPGNVTEVSSARYGDTTSWVVRSLGSTTVASWPLASTGAPTL